jgi:hypothetical protein
MAICTSVAEFDGTARFVVYCTCAKYRVVEYHRVYHFIDILECPLTVGPRSSPASVVVISVNYFVVVGYIF